MEGISLSTLLGSDLLTGTVALFETRDGMTGKEGGRTNHGRSRAGMAGGLVLSMEDEKGIETQL